MKQALADGKTTALIYTGGTEQRGPQNANGGHNLIARHVARAVATKTSLPVLGNILLATDRGQLKLAATNLEIGITSWIDCAIPAICWSVMSYTGTASSRQRSYSLDCASKFGAVRPFSQRLTVANDTFSCSANSLWLRCKKPRICWISFCIGSPHKLYHVFYFIG